MLLYRTAPCPVSKFRCDSCNVYRSCTMRGVQKTCVFPLLRRVSACNNYNAFRGETPVRLPLSGVSFRNLLGTLMVIPRICSSCCTRQLLHPLIETLFARPSERSAMSEWIENFRFAVPTGYTVRYQNGVTATNLGVHGVRPMAHRGAAKRYGAFRK